MTSPIVPLHSPRPKVAEFFAGVGLAKMGLERAGFEVAWANDIEPFKKKLYDAQFAARQGSEGELLLADINDVHSGNIPDVELAWASFPCTDLSLAGGRAGLRGHHSSTFYRLIDILKSMKREGRLPRVIALENVTALASSHGGEDLNAAVRELNELGYSVDVVTIDARRFVPQSRPRLFIVGAVNPPEDQPEVNPDLRPDWLQAVFGDPGLRTHRAALPALPSPLTEGLGRLVENVPESDDRWWDDERVQKFTNSLSLIQEQRLRGLVSGANRSFRTAYRRTRKGKPVWEIRPDDISGCLRTARGGSSKQAVVMAGHGSLSVRWMTALEYARLMGAGEYNIGGSRSSHVIFGFGDAVCVDAVAWLGENYLLPLVADREMKSSTVEVFDDEQRDCVLQRA